MPALWQQQTRHWLGWVAAWGGRCRPCGRSALTCWWRWMHGELSWAELSGWLRCSQRPAAGMLLHAASLSNAQALSLLQAGL